MSKPARAFQGDPKLKQALIEAIANPAEGKDIWSAYPESPADIAAYCETNGFELPFFYLVRDLFGPGSGEYSPAELAKVISALPVSADTDAVVRDWLSWLWDQKSQSLKSALSNTGAQAAGDQMLALVHRSKAAVVTKQEWRAARNALFCVEGLDTVQRGAVAALGNMGWDLASTPSAVNDVVREVLGTLSTDFFDKAGWTDADKVAMQDAMVRQYGVATEQMGQMPDRNDVEAFTAYANGVREIAAKQVTEIEQAHHDRYVALAQESSAIVKKCRDELRDGLVTVMEAAAEPVSA